MRACFIGTILLVACGSEETRPSGGACDPTVDAECATTSTTTGGGGPSGGGGGQSTGGMGGTGGGGGEPSDPCLMATPTCPATPVDGYGEGDGLLPIDRCAFPIADDDVWASQVALADQLVAMNAAAPLAAVLENLNRAASGEGSNVPGSPASTVRSFRWDATDDGVDWWIPQGISGSADAHASGSVAGKELVIASWYYDIAKHPGSVGEKGVRLSLADVSDPADVRYRHLLLVEPKLVGGVADFVPVNIHAGGVVWIGDYLYVADTSKGFRVFDMTRIIEVSTAKDQIGYDATDGIHYAGLYRYAVPQVGRYTHASACSPRFSFVALDRSTPTPTLVSGEYDANSIYGRLYRWPLSGDTIGTGTRFPIAAWHSGHSHVQGAVAHDGVMWLSSSKPPANGGDLYRTTENAPSTTLAWNDWPEDMMYDVTRDLLWSLSEGDGARWVFAVDMSQYP